LRGDVRSEEPAAGGAVLFIGREERDGQKRLGRDRSETTGSRTTPKNKTK